MNKYVNFLCVLFVIITGCSGGGEGDDEINITDKITSLTLSSSQDQAVVGQTLLFSAIDNTGAVRTYDAKYYVNNVEIEGNTYLFNEVGTFQIYATYQNVTSQTLEIKINPEPIEFKKRVLVEDYTGTWCGWCPRISYALEKIQDQTNDVVIVAIHAGDPMQFNQLSTLTNVYNPQGTYPRGIINRSTLWNPAHESNIQQVTAQLYEPAYVGLATNSSINGNNLSITTKVKIGSSYSSLKLVVLILEDNLVYDQVNYTSYYSDITKRGNWNGQTTDIAYGFIHNNTLRESITNVFGDLIPSENLGHGKVYQKSFTYSIPSNYKKENIKIVSFVTIGDSNKAINVRVANIGEEQSIEEN